MENARITALMTGFVEGWHPVLRLGRLDKPVKGVHRFIECVLEELVHWMIQNFQCDFGCLGRVEKAASTHCFQAHAGMVIVGLNFEQAQRIGYGISPIGQEAG